MTPTTPPRYARAIPEVEKPYTLGYKVPAVELRMLDHTRPLAPYIRPAYTTMGYEKNLKGAHMVRRSRFGRLCGQTLSFCQYVFLE
jgi:hypothetical protein